MSRKSNPDAVQDEPILETETPPAPPPPAVSPAAPREEQQPQHGGSFLRQPDGGLTLIERTRQPDESQEA